MNKEELEYSVKQALRCEFDIAQEYRAIEIYKTSKQLGYDEEAEEMKSDIYAEFNINLD